MGNKGIVQPIRKISCNFLAFSKPINPHNVVYISIGLPNPF